MEHHHQSYLSQASKHYANARGETNPSNLSHKHA